MTDRTKPALNERTAGCRAGVHDTKVCNKAQGDEFLCNHNRLILVWELVRLGKTNCKIWLFGFLLILVCPNCGRTPGLFHSGTSKSRVM